MSDIPFLHGDSEDVENTQVGRLATANCTAVLKSLKRKTLKFEQDRSYISQLLTKVVLFNKQKPVLTESVMKRIKTISYD